MALATHSPRRTFFTLCFITFFDAFFLQDTSESAAHPPSSDARQPETVLSKPLPNQLLT
jgi:hypothetical protein